MRRTCLSRDTKLPKEKLLDIRGNSQSILLAKKKKKKCLPLFSSPLQLSVHINLMGNRDGRVLCLKASRLLPPRGIGSDLILLANVVRGRLHLP